MPPTPHKKILIIDPANFIGGAELFMLDFLQYSTQEKNFSFIVATTGNKEYINKLPKKVKIIQTQLPRIQKTFTSLFSLPTAIKNLTSHIRKEKIDIILTNSVRAHILASLAAKKTKTPLIWIMHDFTFPKILLKFFAKYPQKILCVSHIVKEYVSSSLSSQDQSKLTVIYNGIDLATITDRIRNKELGITKKKDEYWVGIIGRIEPWKGQKYFVLAAKEVLQKIPNARFFIIGAPASHDKQSVSYFHTLKKFIKKERLDQKIRFTGYTKNVYPFINKLDILVHASIEQEPFGRVVLEGMALKKPVIASLFGGPKEIIDHEKDGYLIDPKNTKELSSCIIALLQDKKKRNTIGEAGYKKVQKQFLQEKTVKALMGVIKRVMG